MTLGAEVDLVGPEGQRTLPLQHLYIGHARHDGSAEGDGKHYLALQPGELVAAVRAKRTPGLRSAYDKIRIRRSIEYPVAGVAVALRREGDALADLRVAITGTNPRPVLLEGTDSAVRRRARRARAQGPGRPRARPDHVDEDDVHARPLPPPRRRRAGAPAGGAAVRGALRDGPASGPGTARQRRPLCLRGVQRAPRSLTFWRCAREQAARTCRPRYGPRMRDWSGVSSSAHACAQDGEEFYHGDAHLPESERVEVVGENRFAAVNDAQPVHRLMVLLYVRPEFVTTMHRSQRWDATMPRAASRISS